jgi:DnaJ-class molecular chaperone
MRSSCLGLSDASTGTFSILSSVSRPSITCMFKGKHAKDGRLVVEMKRCHLTGAVEQLQAQMALVANCPACQGLHRNGCCWRWACYWP